MAFESLSERLQNAIKMFRGTKEITEEDLKAASGDAQYTDVLLGEAAEYTNTVEIGFYTKQID
mgnify:CR=1 FL=1